MRVKLASVARGAKIAVAALAAIALSVPLAACGNRMSAAGTSCSVTLDFFQFKAEATQQFEDLSRQFEKQNPGICINVNNSSSGTTDLRTRLVKNRIPDVITLNGDINFGQFASTGVFHDFNDDPIVKKLNPRMVQIARDLNQSTNPAEKKKLYGLPFAGTASGYIYNTTLWRKAGIDPDIPPTTWSGFKQVVAKLKAAGIDPVQDSLADSWTTQAPLASVGGTLVPISTYQKISDGETDFQHAWKLTAERVVELMNMTTSTKGVTYGEATQRFAQGKAGILPLGSYALPQIRSVQKGLDLGFAQLPATDDPKKQILVAGDDVMLTMGATTKHPKEAMKFINFLMSEKSLNDYADSQSAITPLKKTHFGDPALKTVRQFYTSGRLADFDDHFIPASIPLGGYVQTLITSKNVNRFLDQMQSDWVKVKARDFSNM